MKTVKRRFFAGFMKSQAKWLNSMADKGLRLVKTGKLTYEFEDCDPGKYRYTVEYVGDKSLKEAENYKEFLESMGYRAFFKNINLDYSLYKVTWRPWAEKGGRISDTRTTFNRELLIVEKENDGSPFELHTEKEDIIEYYRRLSYPAYYAVFLALVVLVISWPFVPLVITFAVLAIVFALPIIVSEYKISRIKKEKNLEE